MGAIVSCVCSFCRRLLLFLLLTTKQIRSVFHAIGNALSAIVNGIAGILKAIINGSYFCSPLLLYSY